jgi:hypothetical protein
MVRYNKKYGIIKIKDLRELCKHYNLIPSGNSKYGIITQLPVEAFEKLERLYLYHTANKIKAIYLSKTENKLKLDELEVKLKNLGKRLC